MSSINKRPDIFISATSCDLDTARAVVKNALLAIDCHPVDQSNFPPDYREVEQMLSDKIESCDAVIHLVGKRYGAEPDPTSLPAGVERRSYTQMEADIALRFGKKMYIFLCNDDYPFGSFQPESDELINLQRAYRKKVEANKHLYTPVHDDSVLSNRVREIQAQLEDLKQSVNTLEQTVSANRKSYYRVFGICLLLVCFTLAGIYFTKKGNDEQTIRGEKLQEVVSDEIKQLRIDLNQVVETRAKLSINPNPQLGSQSRQQAEYQLAIALRWDLEKLQKVVASGLASTDALLKAQALLASGDTKQADKKADEVLALEADVTSRLRKAYEVKTQIAFGQGRWGDAVEHMRKILAFTNKTYNPHGWGYARGKLAVLLGHQGKTEEAISISRDLLDFAIEILGPDHPNTAHAMALTSWLLAIAGNYEEAEKLQRRTLVIDIANFGGIHPNVARSKLQLAQTLIQLKRYEEAESLLRAAIRICAAKESALSMDSEFIQSNFNLLVEAQACNQLARILESRDKNYVEATRWRNRAVKIYEEVYSDNHAYSASSLVEMAALQHKQGRYQDAQKFLKRALAYYESIGGEDYLTVLAMYAARTNNIQGPKNALPLYHKLLTKSVKLVDNHQIKNEIHTALIDEYRLVLKNLKLSQNQIDERIKPFLRDRKNSQ